MAVETGLGGRLDATNILDPHVSVITVIEKEHTEILGDTLEKIAAEKAGIIKAGRPLVLAEQSGEALDVFMKKAGITESPLYYFPEACALSGLIVDREGTSFDLVIHSPLFEWNLKELRLPVPGEVQAKNAALAVLAVKTAFPTVDEKAAREGLAHFTLPARFEKICRDPVFVIDGAHTALSAAECVRTFTGLYGSGGILLFGCAEGKDVSSMASAFIPCFSRIIITTPGNFKKSSPKAVYDVFANMAEYGSGREILFIPDTEAALNHALELGRSFRLPVLGAGSFYLAAEFRRKFSGDL
jgi:dihydrofolate synthase/folylpolyglutamate synthase